MFGILPWQHVKCPNCKTKLAIPKFSASDYERGVVGALFAKNKHDKGVYLCVPCAKRRRADYEARPHA